MGIVYMCVIEGSRFPTHDKARYRVCVCVRGYTMQQCVCVRHQINVKVCERYDRERACARERRASMNVCDRWKIMRMCVSEWQI